MRRSRGASAARKRTVWLIEILDRKTALDSGGEYTVLA
jgi:hypothetical protein